MNKEYIETFFEYRTGNIFNQKDLNVIIHQCNCFHIMGAGIAGQIRKIYPNVYGEDCKKTIYGDKNKMGTNLYVDIVPFDGFKLNQIVNMYCQYELGRYSNQKDYEWRINSIKKCLKDIKNHYINSNVVIKIGVPYLIGCGISGLKEEDVFQIFVEVFENNMKNNIKIIFVDYNKSLK